MKSIFFAITTVIVLGLASCGGRTSNDHDHNHEDGSEHNHDHAAEEHEHTADDHDDEVDADENPNVVVFTKMQQAKINFATDEVRSEPFGQIIRTTAQILPSPSDERTIIAKAGGTVFFSGIIAEGTTVTADQPLFSIDGNATADNSLAVRYAEAESEYNRARIEYNHKIELAKDNIVSQDDLLKAKTEFASAEANYNNLKTNFSDGRQNISSPVDGFVTRVPVQNGQYVEAGQPVLVVSQNRNLLVKAELQPKYFDALNSIASANIRLLNSNCTYTLEELGGKLLSFGKSADVNNPLIPVVFQVRVNNYLPIHAGGFVEMFIKTQTNAQALTVPNEAIVEEMGNLFVFVQLTPELFEKHFVQTGVTDGIRTEIKSGIVAGNCVVSKGAMLIKLAQSSGALDAHAGHVH